MKILNEKYNIIAETLMKQRVNNNIRYRKIAYSVDFQIDNGGLIYHTFTREILFLTS